MRQSWHTRLPPDPSCSCSVHGTHGIRILCVAASSAFEATSLAASLINYITRLTSPARVCGDFPVDLSARKVSPVRGGLLEPLEAPRMERTRSVLAARFAPNPNTSHSFRADRSRASSNAQIHNLVLALGRAIGTSLP
jgi:hypothetical protein